MSYGSNQSEHSRGPACIFGRVLKGSKPSDIRIFRPTKFELAVNLKIEKALVSKCRLSHSRSLARYLNETARFCSEAAAHSQM